MSLDHALLGFLAGEDLSGYDLKTRCLDERIAHFWTADQAQIYRTLERLERSRLVTTKRHRQQRRPDRKVFSITRAGREALDEWLGTPHPLPSYRDAFLIQVYFGADIPTDRLVAVLETHRELRQERLLALRAAARSADLERDARDPAAALRRMSFNAAMASERSAIDWLDDCLEELASFEIPAGAQRTLFPSGAVRGGDA